MAALSLVVAASWTISACAKGDVEFYPRTSMDVGQSVRRAVAVYAEDLPAIEDVPYRVLGTLAIDIRKRGTSEYMQRRASRDGARHGGTHVVLIDDQSRSYYAGDRAAVTPVGSALIAVQRPVYHNVRSTRWLVVVVPPDAWATLPPHLIPVTR